MFENKELKWDELLIKHSKKLVNIKWKFKNVFDEIEDHTFDQIEIFSSENPGAKVNFEEITLSVLSKVDQQNVNAKDAFDSIYNENNLYGFKGELHVNKVYEIRNLFREKNWFISHSGIEEAKIAVLFYFEIQCVLEITVPGLFKLSERYVSLSQMNGISLLSAILLTKGCSL